MGIFNYQVARNKIDGTETWNKWGYNGDVDIGTETIWSPGGTPAPMPSAQTLTITSSSTDDDSTGTGAQSIIIYGVDGSYQSQIEVVTMDGTSNVVTSNTWLGVNRMAIYLAGTGKTNAGIITATATSAATTQAAIPAASGSTQHAFFFVQAGYTALADWLWINAIKTAGGAKPELTIKGIVTSLVSGAQYDVFTGYMDVNVSNSLELRPSQPFVVGEKSLLEFRCTSNTDNAAITCRFSLIEISDEA